MLQCPFPWWGQVESTLKTHCPVWYSPVQAVQDRVVMTSPGEGKSQPPFTQVCRDGGSHCARAPGPTVPHRSPEKEEQRRPAWEVALTCMKMAAGGRSQNIAAHPQCLSGGSLGLSSPHPRARVFKGILSFLPSSTHQTCAKAPLNSGNWGFNPRKQCTVPTLKDV